ncbi:helix-turn-helix domain-containing protein [Nonomuraea rosea]
MTNGTSPPVGCRTCGHHCADAPLVLDVPDVQRLLKLKSRRSVEKLIHSGKLKSYLVGRLRRIDIQAVHDFLAEAESPESRAAAS